MSYVEGITKVEYNDVILDFCLICVSLTKKMHLVVIAAQSFPASEKTFLQIYLDRYKSFTGLIVCSGVS